MKILFQGDSITDANRDRNDAHNLAGYSTYAAEGLKAKYPKKDFEFLNLGISGNRTIDLVNRYESDFKAIQPDIISIFIGINDVWHYFADCSKYVSPSSFENNYRYVLSNLKKDTNAKIIMIEPFLLPAPDKLIWKMDLNELIEKVRLLAVEFADEYIPLDGLFAKEQLKTPWNEFSNDGVHPIEKGQKLIAEYYVEAASKIIDKYGL